jgi:plasmid stabilization system protein ParE
VNARLTPEAEADLAEAQNWYRQRGTQVTRDFRQAVQAGLELIERHPMGHPTVYRNVRRVLLHRFPYSLFYFIDGDIAVVIGCFHGARDPRIWQDRSDAALD